MNRNSILRVAVAVGIDFSEHDEDKLIEFAMKSAALLTGWVQISQCPPPKHKTVSFLTDTGQVEQNFSYGFNIDGELSYHEATRNTYVAWRY